MRNGYFKKIAVYCIKLKIRTPGGIRIILWQDVPAVTLRQIITLLQEPQLQVQPQQPSSSYDE